MAADGTVNIDVVLHSEQVKQKANEIDDLLNNAGKDAGSKAEENLRNELNMLMSRWKMQLNR